MASAQETYRAEFRSHVLALEPRSILEVGCGAGTFLRSLSGWTGRLVGVDIDEGLVAQLKEQGFNVRRGPAEQLSFDDAEFDVVVSSYTAHHLPDWPAALREALRVARRAVCILDAWYDESIPSHRVAADFDRWSKEIDRIGGMIHNECLSLGALLSPIKGVPGYEINALQRALVADADLVDFEQRGADQLRAVNNAPDFTRRYETISADARRDGIAHDGAVMVTIKRAAAR